MKRIASLLLSLVMLVGCCAMTVSADVIFNDGTLNWEDKQGSFVVGEAMVSDDGTVVVPVCVENNPGIISLKLDVHYDSDVLKLIDVAAGDFSAGEWNLSFGPMENIPFIINWVDALQGGDVTTNGVVAYLTFAVLSNDVETTEISLSYDPNDVFDTDLNNVEFQCVSGVITMPDTTVYGDNDQDGKINLRDLGLLVRYLNKWDVAINLKAADVNCDGNVNVRDLAILQRYINGWDVVLGPGYEPAPPAEIEVELPPVNYDLDGKNRILLQTSEVIKEDDVTKASFTFVNVSKQNGQGWIIPEYSQVNYTCYDVQGNVLTTDAMTIGALELDESITCVIVLPEGTARVEFTDHNLEYWTPWR